MIFKREKRNMSCVDLMIEQQSLDEFVASVQKYKAKILFNNRCWAFFNKFGKVNL